MGQYVAPLRDMQFVLHELLHVEDEFKALPPYAEVNRDLADQVLEEGGKFAAEIIFPLNQSGDAESHDEADSPCPSNQPIAFHGASCDLPR